MREFIYHTKLAKKNIIPLLFFVPKFKKIILTTKIPRQRVFKD